MIEGRSQSLWPLVPRVFDPQAPILVMAIRVPDQGVQNQIFRELALGAFPRVQGRETLFQRAPDGWQSMLRVAER